MQYVVLYDKIKPEVTNEIGTLIFDSKVLNMIVIDTNIHSNHLLLRMSDEEMQSVIKIYELKNHISSNKNYRWR